jgi:hypothetical protein
VKIVDIQTTSLSSSKAATITPLEDSGHCTLIDETGESYFADIVIAADGLLSSIRKMIIDTTSSSFNPPNHLQYRGYKVYRGFLPQNQLSSSWIDPEYEAWQAWGVGSRFAIVPTIDGIAWFAAVSHSPPPPPPPLSPSSQSQSSNNSLQRDEDFNYYYYYYTMNNDHNHYLSRHQSLQQQLLKHLEPRITSFVGKWHPSIISMVKNTKPENIIVNYAFANKQIHSHLLTGYYPTTIRHTNGTMSFLPLHHPNQKHPKTLFFFIGDAAHTVSETRPSPSPLFKPY